MRRGVAGTSERKSRRGPRFRRISYRWDAAGNLLEKMTDGKRETYTYGSRNELTSVNGLPVLHDADGNMTHEPLDGHWVRRYVFDPENVVAKTWREHVGSAEAAGCKAGDHGEGEDDDSDSDGHEHRHDAGSIQGKAEKKGHEKDHGGKGGIGHQPPRHVHDLRHFFPDADGRRVAVEAWNGKLDNEDPSEDPQTRELRFWTGGSVVEDATFFPSQASKGHDGKGRPLRVDHRSYVRGNGGLLLELHDKTRNERLEEARDEDRVFGLDFLGSTLISRLVANPGPANEFSYLPFGELARGDRKAAFTYTGHRSEDLGGSAKDQMLAAPHRDLRPRLARWTQADPAGFVDGGNLYRYVSGRSITAIDVSGLAWTFPQVVGDLGSSVAGREALGIVMRFQDPGRGVPHPFPSSSGKPSEFFFNNINSFPNGDEGTSLIELNSSLTVEEAAAFFIHEADHIARVREIPAGFVPTVPSELDAEKRADQPAFRHMLRKLISFGVEASDEAAVESVMGLYFPHLIGARFLAWRSGLGPSGDTSLYDSIARSHWPPSSFDLRPHPMCPKRELRTLDYNWPSDRRTGSQ